METLSFAFGVLAMVAIMLVVVVVADTKLVVLA